MAVDEVRDLIPLYALDALEGDEQIAVQSHLHGCGECRAELARQDATVAELIPDEGPPTGVWQRIVDEIDLHEIDRAVSIHGGPNRSRGLKWLVTVAAGAVLVLAAGVVAQRMVDQPLSGSQAVLAAAEVATTGEGAIVAELVGDAGTVARVVLTAEGEGFVLPAGLDPLGPDRTYQLWVITADDLVISAGVLGADPAPARFTWNGEVAGFALTREVAGGVVSSAGDVVAAVET